MPNGSAGEQAIRGFTQGITGGVQLGLSIQEQRAKVDARQGEIQKEKFNKGIKLLELGAQYSKVKDPAYRQKGMQFTKEGGLLLGMPMPTEMPEFTDDFEEIRGGIEESIKGFRKFGDENVLRDSLNTLYTKAGGVMEAAEAKRFEERTEAQVGREVAQKEQALLGQVARLPGLEETGVITPAQRSEAEIQGLQEAGEKGEQLLTKRLESQIAAAPKPADEKETFARASSLRKEFTTLAKTFRDVRDSFARVQSSSEDPSAAGDLALIFNYMKMLDPASVVRESEFANAAATGAWGERLKAAGARMLEGERLSDVMRADFVDRATRLSKRQNAQHKQREETFRGLAKRAKVSPRDVVIDLSDPRIDEEVVGRIIVNPQTGERMQEVNGKWQKI